MGDVSGAFDGGFVLTRGSQRIGKLTKISHSHVSTRQRPKVRISESLCDDEIDSNIFTKGCIVNMRSTKSVSSWKSHLYVKCVSNYIFPSTFIGNVLRLPRYRTASVRKQFPDL